MRTLRSLLVGTLLLLPAFAPAGAQGFTSDDPVLRRIWTLGMDSSQVWPLAQSLLDSIGPRLTGSPGHKAGNDWLVAMYARWGITARNERYGTWRSWRRGITHVDLVQPRVRSLEGTMVAWSPPTPGGRPVTGAAVVLPQVRDSSEFARWLAGARGKFVLISMPQPTCRPDTNWRGHARPETFARMRAERDSLTARWTARVRATGQTAATIGQRMEAAGIAGVIQSNWSQGWGVNKIFSTRNTRVPQIDLSCEDYGLVHRLAERGQNPLLRVEADAQFLGEQPVFNTIAELRGSEKPNEFVMLSAHFDSWDAASGATDNGTGTVVMMEAMRILKQVLPNPRRTILVGHWGGEEQGLNGSRAFTEDHPEVVQGLQALFNQDNGTGRVANLGSSGLVDAAAPLARWIARLPSDLLRDATISFPGTPPGGGSDHASFVCAGAPGFGLSSNSWEYGTYTWHTNRDTFDKIVWEDLRMNAVLTAMLAYQAAQDPETVGRTRRVLGVNPNTGRPQQWPACVKAARSSEGSAR